MLAIYSAIIGSVIGAVYQQLYNKTLDTFAGAFLVVTAGVTLTAVPAFTISYKAMKTFKDGEVKNVPVPIQTISVVTKL